LNSLQKKENRLSRPRGGGPGKSDLRSAQNGSQQKQKRGRLHGPGSTGCPSPPRRRIVPFSGTRWLVFRPSVEDPRPGDHSSALCSILSMPSRSISRTVEKPSKLAEPRPGEIVSGPTLSNYSGTTLPPPYGQASPVPYCRIIRPFAGSTGQDPPSPPQPRRRLPRRILPEWPSRILQQRGDSGQGSTWSPLQGDLPTPFPRWKNPRKSIGNPGRPA
jgi:hypothetical protein